MNGLVKGGLAVGGLIVGLGALRRALNPSPRYAPWEKPPYEEFEKKVLILGGGFGGYTAAKDLCELTKTRQALAVLVLTNHHFSTLSPTVADTDRRDRD